MQSFSDTHAKHILASLPPISPPWGPEGDRLRRREDREDIRSVSERKLLVAKPNAPSKARSPSSVLVPTSASVRW